MAFCLLSGEAAKIAECHYAMNDNIVFIFG